MSWGVATQNGVSVSLASIVSLSCGATEFSPASLFTSGVQGAWYDPSDYSTLFQDSSGTTPITAVEQPVGLMLDKSQGLVTTPTAIDGNLNTATWTKGTGWSAPSARSLVCDGTQTATSDTSTSYTKPTGALVRWSFTVSAISGTLSVYPTGGNPATITTTGAKTVVSDASSNFNIFRMGAGSTCTITDIRIEIIAGNHALQATAASRPVLRARYNLLTYSEQFDNAAWTKSNAAVTANATTAPDGALTADLLTPDTTAAAFHLTSQSNALLGATVISVYAKPNGYDKLAISVQFASVVVFDVTAGTVVSGGAAASIQSVGNGWYRCSYSFTRTGTSNIEIGVARQSDGAWVGWAPNGTSGIYIWGAQSNLGTSIGTYQQIAAATSYNTVGFLPYLSLDGVDDSYGTGSINFTATDKMSVVAGVTKLSDAAQAVVAELSATIATNNGSFLMTAPNSAAANFNFSSKGTTQVDNTVTTYASPYTAVLAGSGDIAGGTNSVKVNGGTATTVTSSQGTGNYGNYALYVGRRNNATLPLNGRLYQMVICGKALSASELASTEAYVNTKTGAY